LDGVEDKLFVVDGVEVEDKVCVEVEDADWLLDDGDGILDDGEWLGGNGDCEGGG